MGTLATAIPLLMSPPSFADTVEHRGDGWCLSHDAAFVEYTARASVYGRSEPRFFVPAPFERVAGAEVGEDLGLDVVYVKNSVPNRNVRLENRTRHAQSCDVVVSEYGLQVFLQKGQTRCSSGVNRDYYIPEILDDAFGGNIIRCSRANGIVGCNQSNIMANGWEAQILLPIDQLSEWKIASRAANDFFSKNLTDCSSPD